MNADKSQEPGDQDDWGNDEMRQAEWEALWPSPLPKLGDKFFQTDQDKDRKWLDDMLPSHSRVEGYRSAAESLFVEIIASIERTKIIPEWPQPTPMSSEHWLIYPMYFLFRHAIELSLKEMLNRPDCFKMLSLKQQEKLTQTHNLKELWKMAEPWVQRVVRNRMLESTKAFETLLDEVTENDPDGQGGRYHYITDPKNKKNKNFLVFAGIAPLSAQPIRDSSVAMLNFLHHIRSYDDENRQDRP